MCDTNLCRTPWSNLFSSSLLFITSAWRGSQNRWLLVSVIAHSSSRWEYVSVWSNCELSSFITRSSFFVRYPRDSPSCCDPFQIEHPDLIHCELSFVLVQMSVHLLLHLQHGTFTWEICNFLFRNIKDRLQIGYVTLCFSVCVLSHTIQFLLELLIQDLQRRCEVCQDLPTSFPVFLDVLISKLEIVILLVSLLSRIHITMLRVIIRVKR